VAHGFLKPDHYFVMESPANLKIMGIDYQRDDPFLPGYPTLWTPKSQYKKLGAADIAYLNPASLLAYHLSIIFKQHAADFIGVQEVKGLIEKMNENFPDIVEEIQKVLSIPQITEILQRLVQEDISIRNLKTIFQALIEWAPKEKDVVMLTEYVRTGLKRYISYHFSGGQNLLAAFMLDQEVEETIRKAIRKTGATSYLMLAPNKAKLIMEAVKKSFGGAMLQAIPPVLLTSMDIRRYVKKLIETEVKALPVLSYQELTTDLTIQPLGRICL
jgi:type III secretion protein V